MERNLIVDILKFIMSFFIVALHYSFLQDLNPEISNYLNQGLFRLSVPIFLIINGYYFFTIDSKLKYKKWLKKIIWLYAFWTIVYLYYILKLDINHIILALLSGYYQLWYIVAMIGASLIVFVSRNINVKYLLYLGVGLYCIGCIIQYLSSYGLVTLFQEFKNIKTEGVPSIFYRNFLFFGTPFFLIGFLYKKFELSINKKISNRINYYLVTAFVLLFVEIYLNQKYAIQKSFDLLFCLIIVAPLIFIKCKFYTFTYNSKILGLLSSSIYFVHPLVYFLFVEGLYLAYTFQVIVTFVLSILFSIPLLFINKKITIV